MKQKVRYQGHCIGEIDDNVYVTYRRKIHFMQKYNGFGISKKVIDVLADNHIEKVRVIYVIGGRRKVYECDLMSFVKSKMTWSFERGDMQKFVSIEDMELMEDKPV